MGTILSNIKIKIIEPPLKPAAIAKNTVSQLLFHNNGLNHCQNIYPSLLGVKWDGDSLILFMSRDVAYGNHLKT